MAADSVKNIKILEQLISQLDIEMQMLNDAIDQCNDQLNTIQSSRRLIYQITEDYKPINPQKIKPYLDRVGNSAQELKDMRLPIDQLKDNLMTAKDELKALRKYYYEQYMVTVERKNMSKRGN